MGKKQHSWTLSIIAATAILVFLAILLYEILTPVMATTALYFNAETELPDDRLYLQNPGNATYLVHTLKPESEYTVLFTVESGEIDPMDYVLDIRSRIHSGRLEFSLAPEEERTFTVVISPKEEQRWVLDSVIRSEKADELDLTEHAWLAERTIDIIPQMNSLPLVLAPEYLPLANSLARFGNVYHTNLTLEELKSTPFEKDFTSSSTKVGRKTESTTSIRLHVRDGRLKLSSKTDTKIYTTEEDLFLIKLLKKGHKAEIDPVTDIERTQKLSFLYRIE